MIKDISAFIISSPEIEIIGPQSYNYNCIAFALGITDHSVDPPKNIAHFKEMILAQEQKYEYHGNSVALYGFGPDKIEHAAVHDPKTNKWISKCGPGNLVRHELHAFKDTIYGRLLEIIN